MTVVEPGDMLIVDMIDSYALYARNSIEEDFDRSSPVTVMYRLTPDFFFLSAYDREVIYTRPMPRNWNICPIRRTLC